MEETQQHQAKVPRTYELKRYTSSTCIQKYSFMLIRPPRFTYNPDILNSRRKYKHRYEHAVYHIPFPLSLYSPPNMRYVILYLHGNSSSRYEGYSQLSHLPGEVGLACFDFAGCGNRIEQQYISLGKKEAADVDVAVRFLKERNFKVAVWGRSMGAVSALLSKQCDVIVSDSPFSNLKTLAKEISQTQVPCAFMCFFHCFFPCFFWAVSNDVEEKTGVHPDELSIIDHINDKKTRSILFLAAKGDKMIHFQHAQILYQTFQGQNKKLLLFEGTHHSDRSFEVLIQSYNFIQEALFPPNKNVGDKNVSEKNVQKVSKRQSSEAGQVGSFSILKEQRIQKMSADMKMSVKIQISSKLVEGGQSQNLQVINQYESDRY